MSSKSVNKSWWRKSHLPPQGQSLNPSLAKLSFILAVGLCGINSISTLRKSTDRCLVLVNELLLARSKSFWFNWLLPCTQKGDRCLWWHSFIPALNHLVCKNHISSLLSVKGEWTHDIEMIECPNQSDIKVHMPNGAYMLTAMNWRTPRFL